MECGEGACLPSVGDFAGTAVCEVPLGASRSKAQRLLYAIPAGQFDQPAALTLNQPSSLNLNSNVLTF